MVPADFVTFFSVMAGVGATLFGLIFLVISIRPEVISSENVPVMRQVQATSSYVALLNPLVISLFALVPHSSIGTTTLVMGIIGFVNTFIMGVDLIRDAKGWTKKLRSAFFIFASAVIYGYEVYFAIRLIVVPEDVAILYGLTTLLVIIYVYGIARAWDLVGVRQFHFRDVVAPLFPERVKEIISEASHTDAKEDVSR